MYFLGVLSAFDNETLSCKFSKRRQIIFRSITFHWTPVNEGSNEITLASLVFLCFFAQNDQESGFFKLLLKIIPLAFSGFGLK